MNENSRLAGLNLRLFDGSKPPILYPPTLAELLSVRVNQVFDPPILAKVNRISCYCRKVKPGNLREFLYKVGFSVHDLFPQWKDAVFVNNWIIWECDPVMLEDRSWIRKKVVLSTYLHYVPPNEMSPRGKIFIHLLFTQP